MLRRVGRFFFSFCCATIKRSMIYLAADHRGFQCKEALKAFLGKHGYLYEDKGAFSYDASDDYVDFAVAAAKKIAEHPEQHRGIFICGSGHGMDIVANKFCGVRAALCWNIEVAKQSREHDDANVLVLPADWLEEKQAEGMARVWLEALFSNEERHVRRLGKIGEIEEQNFK